MPEVEDARPRRRSLAYKGLAVALALAGLGILVWLYGSDMAYVAGLVPVRYPYPTALAAGDGVGVASDAMPAGDRLVVPRIGVDVVVAGGSQTAALAEGAYHHAGTPDPGEGGNIVLAGHRNLRVFSLLYRLRPGDAVILYWDGVEHDYRVARVFDVGASDTEILAQTETERLTLYTCLPRFLGDKRTVVIAEPAER